MNSAFSDGDTHHLAVWRASRAGRAGGWLAIVICLLVACYIAFVSPTTVVNNRGDLYFGGGVFVVMTIGVWRFSLYPRLTATSAGLLVTGPLLTRRVPWSEIVDIGPGYYGLEIRRSHGRAVTVWAVQRANMSAWFSRSTTANDVATGILSLAAEHGSPLTHLPAQR